MPRVALTFDDGPGPSTTALLDVLAERGVQATFFLLGANVERARPIALRMAREGHVLGNHTFTHAHHDAIDAPALVAEVARMDALVRAIYADANVPAPSGALPFRLPYGPAPGDPRLEALASMGRTHVHWTSDFGDWLDPPAVELSARMRAHIAEQHERGLDAALCLHDSSRQWNERRSTVEAVRALLADHALSFFTVPV